MKRTFFFGIFFREEIFLEVFGRFFLGLLVIIVLVMRKVRNSD